MRIEFDPVGRTVTFDCPGCGFAHILNVDPAHRPSWTFNGKLDLPTLFPSINATRKFPSGRPTERCHSWVRDGRIEFLSDCTHALAGKTVELPELRSPAQNT